MWYERCRPASILPLIWTSYLSSLDPLLITRDFKLETEFLPLSDRSLFLASARYLHEVRVTAEYSGLVGGACRGVGTESECSIWVAPRAET